MSKVSSPDVRTGGDSPGLRRATHRQRHEPPHGPRNADAHRDAEHGRIELRGVAFDEREQAMLLVRTGRR